MNPLKQPPAQQQQVQPVQTPIQVNRSTTKPHKRRFIVQAPAQPAFIPAQTPGTTTNSSATTATGGMQAQPPSANTTLPAEPKSAQPQQITTRIPCGPSTYYNDDIPVSSASKPDGTHHIMVNINMGARVLNPKDINFNNVGGSPSKKASMVPI